MVAPSRPGVGASSRRRNSRGNAALPSPRAELGRLMAHAPPLSEHSHGRHGRGPDAEGLVGVLDLDAHGKPRGEPDPVERLSTRGTPFTLVPFSGSTAQPSPTTVPRKSSPAFRLEIRSTGAPARNMAELGLPEVRHHVPGAGVDEREDLAPLRAKAPSGNVEIDDPPGERGAVTRV